MLALQGQPKRFANTIRNATKPPKAAFFSSIGNETMTYQVVGEAGKNPDFQNRCWGAVMAMAADIMNAVQDSGSIMDSQNRDLTTLSSKNQAAKFAKLAHLSTDRTIANLVLLNSVIAGDPTNASDSDLQYQVKEIWMILVEIG